MNRVGILIGFGCLLRKQVVWSFILAHVKAGLTFAESDAWSDAVWYSCNKTLSLLCFADYPGFFWGRQLTASVTAAVCRYCHHCYISISLCTTTAPLLLPLLPFKTAAKREGGKKLKLRWVSTSSERDRNGSVGAHSHSGLVQFVVARTSTGRQWIFVLNCTGSGLCQRITKREWVQCTNSVFPLWSGLNESAVASWWRSNCLRPHPLNAGAYTCAVGQVCILDKILRKIESEIVQKFNCTISVE